MLKRFCKIAAFCFVSALFFMMGCGGASAEQPAESPLRIGVAPDNPPIIFKSNGQIKGLEADLAVRLGKELDRPIEFVEVSWNGLIDALLKGDIDIIMSGMTITEARKVRIAFSEPYLKSGLLTAMRARDKQKYTSLDGIIKAFPNVGVVRGTTSEAFVRKNIPRAGRVVLLKKASGAPAELKSRRIDIFIYDAPSIVWLVSENEAEMAGLWKLLNHEDLGWGVRRDDHELLSRVNQALSKWKQDGTLSSVVLRWMPYWERLGQ